MFTPPPGRRIGEVWFADKHDLPLLPKYLFTDERLSVQVHPCDIQAKRRGKPRGKAECWFVLDAQPGSTIGLGLKAKTSAESLRGAALDGSIEDLVSWRPVKAGDFFYVPPGTIHAIGAGISLLEFQQNSDMTYRLYDFGRPRVLHLDDGIAVAHRSSYPDQYYRPASDTQRCTLVDGPVFTLVQSTSDELQDRLRWILPLEGTASFAGREASAGECLLVGAHTRPDRMDGRFLIGALS